MTVSFWGGFSHRLCVASASWYWSFVTITDISRQLSTSFQKDRASRSESAEVCFPNNAHAWILVLNMAIWHGK